MQADNQRLSQQKQEEGSFTEQIDTDIDDDVIHKLKEQIDKHRNEIKQKNREIQGKIETIDQKQVELDFVKQQNCEIKKKSKLLKNQVKKLCDERANFLAKIQDQHCLILSFKKQLGVFDQEDSGKEESSIPRFTIEELKEVLSERNELKNRINDLEEELIACRPMLTNKIESNTYDMEKEEEAPVQGI